ncbi:MAG: vanillate O-demethylase oxidoreductase VanB [Pseudomonadales bacterium]|nr:vanillate O-demethylase oxidoreductase VanB [Pseudomonadales bacterium]
MSGREGSGHAAENTAAQKIERQITVDASVERVWSAISDHEQFGSWFRCVIADPFVVGQTTQARSTSEGNEDSVFAILPKAMDQPHYFAFAWCAGNEKGATDIENVPHTLVEFTIVARAGSCEVTICESGFENLLEGDRDEYFRMNTEGWDAQAKNLKAHFAQ